MHNSISIFTALVLTAALGVGAHAGTPGDPNAKTGRSDVHYGDLDLKRPHDARIMLHRIEQAAKKACGGQPTFSTYTGRLDGTFAQCRREAIARAVEQLGAPLVTSVYSAARPRQS